MNGIRSWTGATGSAVHDSTVSLSGDFHASLKTSEGNGAVVPDLEVMRRGASGGDFPRSAAAFPLRSFPSTAISKTLILQALKNYKALVRGIFNPVDELSYVVFRAVDQRRDRPNLNEVGGGRVERGVTGRPGL